MKKLITLIITICILSSNSFAKSPSKLGQWKETKGSQGEIVKKLQKRD